MMQKWYKIYFNEQNIKLYWKDKVLIKIPKKGLYGGKVFWFPVRLLRDEGGKGYFMSMLVPWNWSFEVFADKFKKTPGKKVESIKLDVEEMLDCWNDHIKNLVEKDNESYLEVVEPTPLVEEVKVSQCLKNN